LVAYFEVYAASRSEQSSSSVNTDVRIVDAKTGALIESVTPLNAISFRRPGSLAIPIAVNLAGDKLSPGLYHLEVNATNFLGTGSAARTTYFEVD